MEEKIIPLFWSARAKKDLKKIYEFEQKIIGEEKSYELVKSIVFSGEKLKEHLYRNYLVDETFKHLKHQYYKQYHQRYKITNRHTAENIFIVRVFDMRKHPDGNR